MRSIPQTEQILRDETGRERRFSYHLLAERVETPALSCENYGVAVEEAGGERAEILGITCSRSRIEELMALLSCHQVSPTALGDVVADWL